MKIFCEGCRKEMVDDEILEVDFMTFHEECLTEYLWQNVIAYDKEEYEAYMITLEKRSEQ